MMNYEIMSLTPCEIIYQPEKPLGCGAALWVQTHSRVEVKRKNYQNLETKVDSCVVNAA
ncbi:MAG: hypothetical protein AAF915_21305 [Cyanobacteria bacterium P01_D01_bin.50]